jgi:hypothetical protein
MFRWVMLPHQVLDLALKHLRKLAGFYVDMHNAGLASQIR